MAAASEGPALDERRAARLLRCFDAEGRLARWPSKRSEQLLALLNGFDDHALLGREMCDLGMMRRTRDGRAYSRIEQPMPAEARALLRRLKDRPLTPGPGG